MAKVWHSQNNFTAGQLSPRLRGRVDIQKYQNGAKTLTNVKVLPHGGITKRGGFHYVAEGKVFQTGSELITNGAFSSNITGWTDKSVGSGSIAHSTNLMNIVSTDASNYGWAEQSITTVAGQQYQLTVTVGTGSVKMRVGTATGGTDVMSDLTLTTGARTVNFTASSTSSFIGFYHTTSATHTIDTVVCKATESKEIFLKRFEFSTTQAYVLEFGDLYFRIYKDEGQVVDSVSGEPIEVVTPYASTDIFDLKFAQDADTLYIAHPSYAPRKITRSSHTSWTISSVSFTGSGGHFPPDFCAGSAGTGSDGNNKNPSAVTFFQERLWWGGSNTDPQKIWASQTGDFENMDQGTALDNEGLEYVFAANDVNVIKWLKSSDSMLIGTVGSEFRLHANGAAVTPANVIITRETNHGSNNVDPVIVGRAVLFAQRTGRKVRQLIFDLNVDGFVAPDLTIVAEDITSSGESTSDGIVDMDYQQELDTIVWTVLDSGSIAAMTYDRDQKVIAWHKHTTEGLFESIAVIPDPPNEEDLVWTVVKRSIGGIQRRYIEYLDRDMFVDSGLTFTTSNPELLTNGTFTTDITSWTDKSVSTGSIAWNTNSKMDLLSTSTSAYGWAEQSITTVVDSDYVITLTVSENPVICRIGTATGGTQIVNDLTLPVGERFIRFKASTTSSFIGFYHTAEGTATIANVSAKLGTTSLSGLDHLEGKSVRITGNNGRVLETKTVASGAVTASEAITSGTVGLAYSGSVKLLLPEFALTDGKIVGRQRSVNRVVAQLHDTNALTINGHALTFRTGADLAQEPPPSFTGVKDITALGYSDNEVETEITQSDPVKMTLLSVTQELNVGD